MLVKIRAFESELSQKLGTSTSPRKKTSGTTIRVGRRDLGTTRTRWKQLPTQRLKVGGLASAGNSSGQIATEPPAVEVEGH